MSSGFPGAHQSWLSPCEEDPNHTKTEGNPPVQKVHRKACNTAKGETKIYKAKFAPHSVYHSSHFSMSNGALGA